MHSHSNAQSIVIAGLWLLFAAAGARVSAQDPGGLCDPEASAGQAARLVSTSATAVVRGYDDRHLQLGPGDPVPPGSEIRTAAGAPAVLALEDGTGGRLSRLRIDPGSRVVVTGGLFCSDLRPKADEGRWNARELGIELCHYENERGMVTNGVVTMAIRQGLLDLQNLQVHSQPDESTRYAVRAGRGRYADESRINGPTVPSSRPVPAAPRRP
jgi:hypothetical protein